MKRQVIGFTLALLLAVGGTFALVSYVRSAKDEAVADEQLAQVYVVSEAISKGTPVPEMGASLELTDVPLRLIVAGAVTDLTTLDPGFVASLDLRRGEQLLTDRLVDPQTLIRVAVPDGMQEITIELSPERAVGGELVPGDTVGVLFSFDSFGGITTDTVTTDPAAAADEVAIRGQRTTHFTLHQLLLTAVQFSRSDLERSSLVLDGADSAGSTADPTASEAPGDRLLVTLAVTSSQAEQIVFAAEFGQIWLTAEGPDAEQDGTRILTYDGVYVTVPR